MGMHWFLCFWGNLAGALFVMAIVYLAVSCAPWPTPGRLASSLTSLALVGGVFGNEPYRSTVISFVTAKQVVPSFSEILVRAIGCNWLVCLALYLSVQAKDVNSKIWAVWWPIFGFVSSRAGPRRREHVLHPDGVVAEHAWPHDWAVYLER